ncbi:MAG: hypothetical protein M0D53_01185 [Flavobacterium sp. JAD_PAG50586_2]|nr:MAG: hypothetical protein M0D53_01185 [Flavobacterium sp. JAD_PAG50586_2]
MEKSKSFKFENVEVTVHKIVEGAKNEHPRLATKEDVYVVKEIKGATYGILIAM